MLDEEQLVRMRAPPAEDEFAPGSDVDDSDEETLGDARDAKGAFPERTESAYY